MNALFIYGAGGHGVVVAEIAAARGMAIAGFIDDNPARIGERVLDWTILGGSTLIPAGAPVALAIGDNHTRAALLALAQAQGWTLPVLAHPSAVISPSATLDAGTVVMPLVAVNARAHVGHACILNTGCSVDHDCRIGDVAHIAPGARLAGSVSIGAGTLFGVGSSARPGICVGAQCVVGVGSVVVADIPDGAVAFGNPARVREIP